MKQHSIKLVLIRFVLLGVLLIGSSACSVYMAANQPREKDLTVLAPGTHRGRVIAELGAPVWTGEKDGNKVDVFTFKDGYSTANRAARAVFHGVSDFFTLGLWEVIGTPTEAIFDGKDMKVEIAYGPDDRVVKTTDLIETAAPAKKPEGSDPQKTETKSPEVTEQAAAEMTN